MTNISKSPLTETQERELLQQLSVLFSERNALITHQLFDELLGHEEKVMLAKRLAIIIMLYKKQSLYFISQSIHVSPATVARQKDLISQGTYEHIIQSLKKPTPTILNILEAIDSILHLGGILPHYGETHASEAFKRQREARRQQ